jgi:signal transduction histidine kinase/ActR/RegA family two-component response regulator
MASPPPALRSAPIAVRVKLPWSFELVSDPGPSELTRVVQELCAPETDGDAPRALRERHAEVEERGRATSFRLDVGEGRTLECQLLPEGRGGSVTSVLCLFTDVTEELEQRETNEERRQLFDVVLGRLPGFCYTVDRNLVFTSSMGAGLGLLNLSPGQCVGGSLTTLWGTTDPAYEPLSCHLRALAGEPQTYKDVCVGRSFEYHLMPLRDAGASIIGVIGVGFDVTEQALAKEEHAKLAAQLRQAQKMEAIGRLAGGVAHDFNNLLTCILGNLSLAETRLETTSPLLRHLAVATAAAESAATLTRQLLAFGRKQVIDPRPVNLSVLIGRVRGMLERMIGDSVTLSIGCADDLWYVQADPGQLEQVLVNLLVNARDAIVGRGEVRVETQNLELAGPNPQVPSTLTPGRYVVLSVTDTGCGMSEVVRSRLFEPFFTTKEMGAGTGLGLATVYGAVQQNGGSIVVDSELGRGSSFRIYLPSVELEPSALADVVTPPPPSRPRGGTETILLVEDEPLVLELAHCALQEAGYNVLACAGSDVALRTFLEHPLPVDLLVTDVVMPRMNGRELAARIGALRPGVAMLFTSGYGEDIIARKGVLEAGLHFIEKPYRVSDLLIKIRKILDARAHTGSPPESGESPAVSLPRAM